MKRIKIHEIKTPDKGSVYIKQRMYSIYLGNEHREYFTNKRDAKRYLSDTNRFLNIKLHQLNHIYTCAFTEYRKIWFFLISEYPERNKRYGEIEKEITTLIASIEKSMNHVVGIHANNNTFSFKNLRSITENLIRILELIRAVLFDRNYYSDIYKNENYLAFLRKIIAELDNYGKEKRNYDDKFFEFLLDEEFQENY